MLLATPFMHIDKVLIGKDGPPRVISEIRKAHIGICRETSRPKLNGDLFVRFGNESQWWPRRVSIRAGQLLIGNVHGETKFGSVKIPLRRLSLSAGKLPNSLSLIKGQNVMLTIQTPNEKSFDLWVKSIAIELIRQTPLEDVKYFDILTVAGNSKSPNEKQRDYNYNCIIADSPLSTNSAISINNANEGTTSHTAPSFTGIVKDPSSEAPSRPKRSTLRNGIAYTTQKSQIYQRNNDNRVVMRARSRSCNSVPKDEVKNRFHEDINKNYILDKPQLVVSFDQVDSASVAIAKNDEKAIEILFKKCQNQENYVPVKEKLLLFETLCRLGRKVRSAEDVHLKMDVGAKRARSLHDLHSASSAGVRQICRYFENKCDSQRNIEEKRLIHSDSHLNTLQKGRCFRSAGCSNLGYA